MTQPLTFHQGDNRDVLRRMIDDGVRVQSVVCDPPYGLVSVAKRFGKGNAAPARFGTDGAFQRASGGFMGQQWDASGIERDPEFWQLIHDILLPGGYCLAFSSPRTGHWMAVAMEQAGFVMHPFLGWCYGSGFPKAHDAAKAIDRELGAERERISVERTPGWQRNIGNTRPYMSDPDHTTVSDDPATAAAAAAWDGWKYGAQSMKPALEPIYVAQRPFDQKNGALNILTHGVGALNIDGCRVKDGDRHPANLLHDGSDAVREMFPEQKGGGTPSRRGPDGDRTVYGKFNGYEPKPGGVGGSSGNASRFFNAFPLDADSLFYCTKANKADRAGSKHPTVKPIALMRWCVRLVTPVGGTVLDPFAGSGTTGAAALAEGFNCVLIEANEEYAADIRHRFDLEPFVLDADIAALIGGDPLLELIG